MSELFKIVSRSIVSERFLLLINFCALLYAIKINITISVIRLKKNCAYKMKKVL